MELMTVNEVCGLLKVKLRTLNRWRAAGKFPAPIKFDSGTVRWERSVVEGWILGQKDG